MRALSESGGIIRAIWLDGKHATRIYRQTPGASSILILILAVGLALVGAFLSLYVDLAFRSSAGFEMSSGIATIRLSDGISERDLTYEAIERIAEEMASIDAAAILHRRRMLIEPGSTVSYTAFVSDGFFDGLRPRIALGRGFQQSEYTQDAEPVVVLSHNYWQQQFDGDRNVLGASLSVAMDPYDVRAQTPPGEPLPDTSRQFRIVGVMDESLTKHFPEVAVWLPIASSASFATSASTRSTLSNLNGRSYIRRKAGVSVQAVINEFNVRYPDGAGLIAPSLAADYSLDAIGDIVSDFAVYRATKRQLELFLVSSLLLALVAAVNASLFLLARAPGRRRELGIRLAVGAPMRRLVSQLATESGLLVIVATALGLLMSLWLATILTALPLMREADWRDATLFAWPVLGACAIVVLVLVLVVSLAPTMGLTRMGLATPSSHVATRASFWQHMAVNVQIAISGAIGGAAIAFAWYLGLLIFGDQGYELKDRYAGSSARVRVSASDAATFVELERRRGVIESIPGVTAVAFGAPLPSLESSSRYRAIIQHPDEPATSINVVAGVAEQGYVNLLGLSLVHGRVPNLMSGDTTGVLVNRTLAHALWGRVDVVGEQIPAGSRAGFSGKEVVGVLEDSSFGHPAASVPPMAWTIIGEVTAVPAETIIESALSAQELQRELNRVAEAGELDPPITSVVPLKESYDRLTAPDRARGFITMASATVVVLLAIFGFHGTQAYLVAAGRREAAIRLAIGAGPRAVGRLVVWRSILMVLPGLLAGGLLAFIVVAWLRDEFLSREVSPMLVTIWVIVGFALLLLAASLGPAGEARRTQPAQLLRES